MPSRQWHVNVPWKETIAEGRWAKGLNSLSSGRRDSNPGPPGPKPGALTKLRYAPLFLAYISETLLRGDM